MNIIPSVITVSYNSDKGHILDNISLITVKLPIFNINTYTDALSSMCHSFVSKLMVNNINLTAYNLNNAYFKDSLCNGMYIDNKLTFFNVYVWEFASRFNHFSPFSFTHNHTFHLFLAVSSMLFLSHKVGAVFFIFIRTALAADVNSKSSFWNVVSLAHFYRILAAILWLIQVISGFFFDLLQYRIYIRKTIRLSVCNYLLCGVSYLTNIITGILFTNALWFLVHPPVNNLHAVFIGSFLSIVLSGFWYKLRRSAKMFNRDPLNSIFRSLMDSMAFISICASTYGSWNLFLNGVSISIAYPLGVTLGLFFHYVSGYFIIGLEFIDGSAFIYGPLYLVWWSSAIFNTNSLVALFIQHIPYNGNMHYWIVSIVLSSISVVFNFPYYYLNAFSGVGSSISPDIELNTLAGQPIVEVTNLSRLHRIAEFITRNRHIIIIRLFICIFSYCLAGGLLWELLISNFVLRN